MVAKRMVFHFYLTEDWDTNFANRIHFKCLSHYTKLFDEVKIVIAVDDENRHLVNDVKKKFIDCIKSETLTFKVVKNDYYCEGGTFKTEIVDKLDSYDGLVFFGHNKGVTCMSTKGDFNEDSLALWITAMYFYNLEFSDDVEKKLLVDAVRTIYGVFLMKGEWFKNASHCFFSGTFYWLNPGRVKKWSLKLPEIYDREYAEWFPGEVFGEEITYYLGSRCEYILCPEDLYRNARNAEYVIGKNDDDRARFKEFFKLITEND